ncbi:hypothetical protein P879_02381 [Paragonimus westermani]|uniref:PH domain-containing protein n=1 Tax=Paragonimus westermani TaxID=34504 RepID=A0A8T0DU56_9TREM|nr:hypothetical protein P879_02381 [Paragonimus westermani]
MQTACVQLMHNNTSKLQVWALNRHWRTSSFEAVVITQQARSLLLRLSFDGHVMISPRDKLAPSVPWVYEKNKRFAPVVECPPEHQYTLDALRAAEKMIAELNETMEEKLQRANQLREQRERELQEMGISIHSEIGVTGIFTPRDTPHLVNLNEDPAMSECLIYYLKEGKTRVGQLHTDCTVEIGLNGEFILKEHCIFFNNQGVVHFQPCENAECYVNGSLINQRVQLFSGARVILGKSHVFRFNNPTKSKEKKSVPTDMSGSMTESIDWTYAICELLDKQGVDLRKEMEERLLEIEAQFRRERDASDRLFEEQKRVRYEYEDRIQSLQEQVERQSMLSSITQDDQMLVDDETTSECTWSEREFQLASWAFDKWRTHQFTSLRDQLWENAVYLKEANALSVELNKNVRFQFTLLTDTPFSPLPPDFNQSCNTSPTVVDRENFDSNTTPQPKRAGVVLSSAIVPSQQTVNELALFRSDEKHVCTKSQRHTMVAVKVQDIMSGAVHYWSLERFRKRLSRMREHYEQQTDFAVLSCSEDNMQSRTIRSSSNDISEKPDRLGEDDEKEIRDPFQARDPWFRLIGRCFVYMSNLLFETNLVQRVAIVNHHGQVSGFICLAIELIADRCPVDVSICQSEDNEAVSSVLTTPIVFDNRAYVDWVTENADLVDVLLRETLVDVDGELYGTLKLGSDLTFRVTVLQMTGISTEFTEVFCQYFFQHRPNEIFCTKPMKNSPDSELVGFYHTQQFTTTVTLAFLDYVRHHPLGFEIYGHVSDTSNSAALESQSTIALPRRFSNFIPSSLSASTPVPPTRLNKTESPSDLFLVHSEDILVWFEILEINANGDYVPVPVDRLDEPPCQGAFLIHQGLQRRLAITLVYESTAPDTLDPITSITTPPTLFQDVYEVVVGRVRDTPDWLESDSETRILSLSLFPVRYLPQAGDDRTFFRFEAAWDSSLHASALLNRVTKPGHRVFMTISCYLDVDGCTRPVCLTKDIAMVVFPREAKLSVASPRLTHNPTNALLRSVQSLWTSFYRVAQTSRVSAVYELLLRRPWVTRDNGHRTRPVMDSSLMYVRGEENLKGWRPRGDSLIIEHQWELDRLDRIKLVEQSRHLILLREALHKLGRNESQVSLDQLVLQSRRRNRSLIRKRKAAWSRTRSDTLKITKNGSVNASPPDLIMEAQFDSGLVASNTTTGSGGYSVEQNREPNQSRQDKGARTVERFSPDPMSRSLFEWNDQTVENGQGSCDEDMRKQMIISRCVEVLTSLLQMTGSLTGDSDSDSSQLKMDPNNLSNQNKLPEKETEQAADMAQSVKIMVTSTTNSDPLANSLMASSDQGDTGGLGNSITTIPRSATAESLQLHPVNDNSGHNHLKRSYRSLIGECVEVRVSPVVSRKGYLMVLEAKTGGWLRRWFVVRRPFLFIYADEHDPIERGLINLTTAKLDYDVNAAFANSPPPNGNQKTDLFRLPTSAESTVLPPTALVTVSTQFNMFTLIGQHHTLLIQTTSESGSDIHDWLYALNPLKAGEIRSRLGRNRRSRKCEHGGLCATKRDKELTSATHE